MAIRTICVGVGRVLVVALCAYLTARAVWITVRGSVAPPALNLPADSAPATPIKPLSDYDAILQRNLFNSAGVNAKATFDTDRCAPSRAADASVFKWAPGGTKPDPMGGFVCAGWQTLKPLGARLVPHFEHGTFDGLVISHVKEEGLLHNVGFRDGDVMHSVNLKEICKPLDGLRIIQELVTATSTTMCIEFTRDGSRWMLTYQASRPASARAEKGKTCPPESPRPHAAEYVVKH